MTRPSRVIIDLKALKHNFSQIKKLTSNSKVMAIVKA
ncbi:MAG: alanine racemase, partial [Legionellales bacterium]|nr:alanine racemase [Legionellales bacterium]